MSRLIQITAMLNAEESAHVNAEAALLGVSKASYIRMLILADMRKLAAK